MQLEYKSGAANVIADSLSRTPLPDKKEKIVLHVSRNQEEDPLFESVRAQQKRDSTLKKLIDYSYL